MDEDKFHQQMRELDREMTKHLAGALFTMTLLIIVVAVIAAVLI